MSVNIEKLKDLAQASLTASANLDAKILANKDAFEEDLKHERARVALFSYLDEEMILEIVDELSHARNNTVVR